MNITPHADNPLPRYAVDKELYQRAVQLGITSESGAAMSDKQFQVDVKGLSFTSGNIFFVFTLIEKCISRGESKTSLSASLLTYTFSALIPRCVALPLEGCIKCTRNYTVKSKNISKIPE